MDFAVLRRKYTELCYESYTSQLRPEELELSFVYRLIAADGESIAFTHIIRYQLVEQGKPVPLPQVAERLKELENLIFQIGLAETINYWKLACPPKLRIACGRLNQAEVAFWQKLYYNGLGEFIYLNGIHRLAPAVTPENWLEIVSAGTHRLPPVSGQDLCGTLIPVGGGKDSVVSLELLRPEMADNLPFVMSAPQAAYDCIVIAGYDRYLQAERKIDAQLLRLNKEGYLNGHVPFSAILAFIAALGAALTHKRYIALSNEKSANEPSVPGTMFNHQYSKTLEFERDFTAYFQGVMPEIRYFSLLRPLYEIEIGKAFAEYPAYHAAFRSCNRGKKTNTWCGHCPKCLFVYIILSPYVEREKLKQMFGKDLLTDESLQPVLYELMGLAETKPFECVGTTWEVRYALEKTAARYGYTPSGADTPVLIAEFLKAALPNAVPDENYESGDCLPEHFRGLTDALRIKSYAPEKG